jgi:hypothetical protein
MGSRPRACPPIALPPVHAHQLCCRIKSHDAVDLSIGVGVVLPRVIPYAIHIHGCDAEVMRLRTGQRDLASSVFAAIDLSLGHPAFLQSLSYIIAEVLIVRVTRAVLRIQFFLQFLSWGPGKRCQLQRQAPRELWAHKCLTSSKNSWHLARNFCAVGYFDTSSTEAASCPVMLGMISSPLEMKQWE